MRKTRAIRVLAAIGIAGSGFGLMPTRLAHAAEPPADWSYYIGTTNTSTLYTLGCNQGTYDAGHGDISSEVILDFGGQQSGGTKLPKGTGAFVPYASVENLAEQFAWGYYTCTGADTTSVLKLGVGTNNSLDVSTTDGLAWAEVVNSVRNWVSSHNAQYQVSVGGANDIEPSWHNYPDTKAWVDEFGSAGGQWYLDFGSADGCPEYTHTNGACNNGWNQNDVWYVAFGASAAYAVPEIYFPGQPEEWGQISQWKPMQFEGPMDEHDLNSGAYTAAQAWSLLENAIGNAYMPAAFEIHNAL